MMRFLALLHIILLVSSCGTNMQNTENSGGIEINPSIEQDVQVHISPSEYGDNMAGLLLYNNEMFIEYYENDSLMIKTEGKQKSSLFKSFYYEQGNDTIGIDGAYGLWQGFGFSLKIIDEEVKVYHLLASDEIPSYAMSKTGEPRDRIEVPCTATKVVLSSLPNSDRDTIYGFVSFESQPYYTIGPTSEGVELDPRKKVRMNMDVYFKSSFVEF